MERHVEIQGKASINFASSAEVCFLSPTPYLEISQVTLEDQAGYSHQSCPMLHTGEQIKGTLLP